MTVALPDLLVKLPQGQSFQGDCGKIPLKGANESTHSALSKLSQAHKMSY